MLVHLSRAILPGGDEVSCGEADEFSGLPVWAILEGRQVFAQVLVHYCHFISRYATFATHDLHYVSR